MLARATGLAAAFAVAGCGQPATQTGPPPSTSAESTLAIDPGAGDAGAPAAHPPDGGPEGGSPAELASRSPTPATSPPPSPAPSPFPARPAPDANAPAVPDGATSRSGDSPPAAPSPAGQPAPPHAPSPGPPPAPAVPPPAQGPPPTIRLAPGVLVDRAAGRIELEGTVCIDAGWLEQVACTPGTREHESLVSLPIRPRDVHAALLLLGLTPGAPGSWRVEEDRLIEVPPQGPPVRVRVRWTSPEGVERTEPIAHWIRDARSGESPALDRWLFAGSLMVPAREGGERYLADASGSIVGLVTFGDEVLALPVVRPDAEAVASPEWEAWTERLPPVGTKVVVLVERE